MLKTVEVCGICQIMKGTTTLATPGRAVPRSPKRPDDTEWISVCDDDEAQTLTIIHQLWLASGEETSGLETRLAEFADGITPGDDNDDNEDQDDDQDEEGTEEEEPATEVDDDLVAAADAANDEILSKQAKPEGEELPPTGFNAIGNSAIRNWAGKVGKPDKQGALYVLGVRLGKKGPISEEIQKIFWADHDNRNDLFVN